MPITKKKPTGLGQRKVSEKSQLSKSDQQVRVSKTCQVSQTSQ